MIREGRSVIRDSEVSGIAPLIARLTIDVIGIESPQPTTG
jgi:hypothetical protein